MSGSDEMIILQTHFENLSNRYMFLQICELGYEVILLLEASPKELLYKFDIRNSHMVHTAFQLT